MKDSSRDFGEEKLNIFLKERVLLWKRGTETTHQRKASVDTVVVECNHMRRKSIKGNHSKSFVTPSTAQLIQCLRGF